MRAEFNYRRKANRKRMLERAVLIKKQNLKLVGLWTYTDKSFSIYDYIDEYRETTGFTINKEKVGHRGIGRCYNSIRIMSGIRKMMTRYHESKGFNPTTYIDEYGTTYYDLLMKKEENYKNKKFVYLPKTLSDERREEEERKNEELKRHRLEIYKQNIREVKKVGGGFNYNKPAILYYLKVTGDNGEVAYKIGITNRTVQQRFCADDLSKIEVITTTEYKIGRNAHKEEQRILNEFKEFKWNGEKLLKSGNTELFDRDVLGLDK